MLAGKASAMSRHNCLRRVQVLFIFLSVTAWFALSFVLSRLSSTIARVDHGTISFFSFTSKYDERTCRVTRSAGAHGIRMNVLDDSVISHELRLKDKKLSKIIALKSVLESREHRRFYNLEDNTIIAFVDATDVVFLGTPDEFETTFLKIEKKWGYGLVLVGAEENCWPYMIGETERLTEGKQTCRLLSAGRETRYKFLNSGTYIGRVIHLLPFLKTVHFQNGVEENRGKRAPGDQLIMQEVFLAQVQGVNFTDFGIRLDSLQEIFQCAVGTQLGTSHSFHLSKGSGAYLDTLSGRVYNEDTSRFPLLIHFNGEKTGFNPVADSVYTVVSGNEKRRKIMAESLKWYTDQYDWARLLCQSIY